MLKFDENTKTKMIGLLTILIGLWLVLYFIPEILISLFNTLLGNLILIITTILVYSANRIYGIITGLSLLILYRFSRLREGFTLTLSGNLNIDPTPQETLQELQQNFLKIQSTINRNTIFDMTEISKQTTPAELKYFNENGMWPWSEEVIELFKEAVNKNPYIRTVPEQAANIARTTYNQNAILRILSYQTKEGQFLLNGVLVEDPSGNKMEELPSGFGNFAYDTGLIENRTDDIIKCNLKNDMNPSLERIRYTGKGGIYGQQTEQVTPVDYNDLESIIPGFKFINGPCNPCAAVGANPDYSCAYKLKVKDKPSFISDIWQYLWNVKDNPLIAESSSS